jgi:hypothetical protein
MSTHEYPASTRTAWLGRPARARAGVRSDGPLHVPPLHATRDACAARRRPQVNMGGVTFRWLRTVHAARLALSSDRLQRFKPPVLVATAGNDRRSPMAQRSGAGRTCEHSSHARRRAVGSAVRFGPHAVCLCASESP